MAKTQCFLIKPERWQTLGKKRVKKKTARITNTKPTSATIYPFWIFMLLKVKEKSNPDHRPCAADGWADGRTAGGFGFPPEPFSSSG